MSTEEERVHRRETLVYGSLPSFPNDCRKIRIIVGVWSVIGLLLFVRFESPPIAYLFSLRSIWFIPDISLLFPSLFF